MLRHCAIPNPHQAVAGTIRDFCANYYFLPYLGFENASRTS
jgi:hypothetical protein